MSSAWDDMRKAKEESYFDRKNREALERLSKKQETEQARISPISGQPMKQEVFHGVVIDRCTQSGGVWLDAGELEQLLEAAKHKAKEDDHSSWADFLKSVVGVK